MKRTKTISLNDKEYTLELNRDSFIQIDKICNLKKLLAQFNKDPYEYVDEIDDDYNPLENTPTMYDIEQQAKELIENTKKLCENSLFVWLYPNHKLKISEVRKLLKPYFEDEDKFEELGKVVRETLDECVKIKDNIESKN